MNATGEEAARQALPRLEVKHVDLRGQPIAGAESGSVGPTRRNQDGEIMLTVGLTVGFLIFGAACGLCGFILWRNWKKKKQAAALTTSLEPVRPSADITYTTDDNRIRSDSSFKTKQLKDALMEDAVLEDEDGLVMPDRERSRDRDEDEGYNDRCLSSMSRLRPFVVFDTSFLAALLSRHQSHIPLRCTDTTLALGGRNDDVRSKTSRTSKRSRRRDDDRRDDRREDGYRRRERDDYRRRDRRDDDYDDMDDRRSRTSRTSKNSSRRPQRRDDD
eukprot:475897-Rhodomonas_salina.1